MAGGLLISLYIYDELSHDTMFADAERIYRIDADIKFGGAAQKSAEVSEPMAEAMQRDFSQIEVTTRFRNQGSLLIRKSGTTANTKELGAAFADSTFFDMFGIDVLVGDTKTALKEPNTLVLTKTAAEKHFGVKNALGQNVLLNNTDTYTVTGVIDDLPKNSFLREHNIFMAMAGNTNLQVGEWGSHNYFTFVKLIPNADVEDFQEPMQSMFETYLIPFVQDIFPGITKESFEASGNYVRYNTIALTDIHLYSDADTELSPVSNMQNVYILFFIGLFLVVLASVNFMNLSTAHSLKRAKEVGIRKTLGSNKRELIWQFLTESGLISFISLLLAIVIAAIATPSFNELSGKTLSIPFANPFFWLVLVISTIFLSILSGSYPALFMSKFIPVKVLKGGNGMSSVGGGKTRNVLVVFQFATSVFLIISTLVVYQQLKFIQDKDLGFAKEQVLIIDDIYVAGDQVESFEEEVRQLAQVKSVTISGYLPTPSFRNNNSFFIEGAEEQENAINMQTWVVDYDYVPTLNMEMIAGRNFDKQFATDSTAMVLNESAAEVLGLLPEEALGIRISNDLGEESPSYFTIIGVVKNFHYESLREDIGALSLTMGSSLGSMAIKLEAGNYSNTITGIEALWQKVVPGQVFGYRFLDDAFNATYQADQLLGRIFIIFTVLSIIIACLGLFGLAAFNAQKRTKEIGVRKVLGASVGQISYRLTMDFLKLVGIGILISLPIGWYAMNKWLEDFSYRMEIGWGVFAVAALLAIVVAAVTVSFQSIKAAIANPAKSLRTE